MDKKSESITFRTTEVNNNFLNEIASADDLTPSYILNRMIKHFREKGISSAFDIK